MNKYRKGVFQFYLALCELSKVLGSDEPAAPSRIKSKEEILKYLQYLNDFNFSLTALAVEKGWANNGPANFYSAMSGVKRVHRKYFSK